MTPTVVTTARDQQLDHPARPYESRDVVVWGTAGFGYRVTDALRTHGGLSVGSWLMPPGADPDRVWEQLRALFPDPRWTPAPVVITIWAGAYHEAPGVGRALTAMQRHIHSNHAAVHLDLSPVPAAPITARTAHAPCALSVPTDRVYLTTTADRALQRAARIHAPDLATAPASGTGPDGVTGRVLATLTQHLPNR